MSQATIATTRNSHVTADGLRTRARMDGCDSTIESTTVAATGGPTKMIAALTNSAMKKTIVASYSRTRVPAYLRSCVAA